jgi:hypothetical protein
MKALKMILAVVLFVLAGCAARPIHPGTANKFDSSVYDVLLTTDRVIQSTKAELTNGTFPPNIQPGVKTALNALIAAYNDADILYCNPPPGAGPTDQCAAASYHAQAIAGQNTPATDAEMQAKISTVNSAVTALATSKGAHN